MTTDLLSLLEAHTPFDDTERVHMDQLKNFLHHTKYAYDRSNLVAHVVADAWIVNPNRDKVVLVEHALNGYWMAPGGHCDGNPDVLASAMREAKEETGLSDLVLLRDGNLFDINAGIVPNRTRHEKTEPAHIHFDVCFAFEAKDTAPLVISNESTQLKWIPLNAFDTVRFHPDHYRRLKKTIEGWL